MAEREPKQKTTTYGSCDIERIMPDSKDKWPTVLHAVLSYEEALKLNMALQSQLMDMSRLNRSYKTGRDAAVDLMIHMEKKRVILSKSKVRSVKNKSEAR